MNKKIWSYTMERKHTGGTKEIRYQKEDLARIRSTDTGSTARFKEALQTYTRERKAERELERHFEQSRRKLIMALVFLFILLCLLLSLRFFS
jgi:hypothetical protein